jgi:transcription initiation factor TFIID subunit 2
MDSLDDQPTGFPMPTFTVAHQKVDLEVNFNQEIRGRTEITIYPDSADLREIRLHGRQCSINKVLVNDQSPLSVRHHDPCSQITLHSDSSVHQHHHLEAKLADARPGRSPDIIIGLPRKLKIVPVEVAVVHTQAGASIKISNPQVQGASTTEVTQALSDTTAAKFTPLTVVIEFESCHAHECLQFVSGKRGKGRWPHVYTRTKPGSGGASPLFPCVDELECRCTWDVSIKCVRTVGDAIRQTVADAENSHLRNGDADVSQRPAHESTEMLVLCSGELTDDIVDKNDPTFKTVSFSCSQQLAPQQVGFAIGPFEKISLGEFRDAQQVEDIGRNAVEILAYCLPGRAEETRNTCLPTTMAIDYVVQKYISCPVKSYLMCFVEDAAEDTSIFAGLTVCSTHLLYADQVIDPAQKVTRTLVHAIVAQWLGVNIIPQTPQDTWLVVGAAYFVVNLFMKELSGNNEYRAHLKYQADRIPEQDYARPSIWDIGACLHVDAGMYDFLALKAPVVLFILDRRIAKREGTSKMPGIIAKIMTKARTGDLENNALSTELFQKAAEKAGHEKIDDFLAQWVRGIGHPRFACTQRFNKKKMVIEMSIKQVQLDRHVTLDIEPGQFMRKIHEAHHGMDPDTEPTVFTGPMTVRIHEADGTPYEHTIVIKDAVTTFEVPYNTKYKRLKRSKKQRARASTKAVAEDGEEEQDSLVYCLGDTMQSEAEEKQWRIVNWTPEQEDKMNAESFEWIRVDADFEWICLSSLNINGYMYVSQLQQDRDVVAHLESIQVISRFPSSQPLSSVLVRTVMDRRYFHGVRVLAAKAMAKHTFEMIEVEVELVKDGETVKEKRMIEVEGVGFFQLKKAYEELFCVMDRGSAMARPNDFSDQMSYNVRCGIIEAMASIRNQNGHAHKEARTFLLDKLKFNDNSVNEYSDAHYISKLMKATTSVALARPRFHEEDIEKNEDIEDEAAELKKFENELLEEIDRYRRMDEWTSSYQNLYSRTALECQAMLAAAGVGDFSPLHFLQYTRPGNYDLLRHAAYNVLITPEIFNNEAVLKYVLYCVVADPSSYIRRGIQEAIGVALGRRAIGEKSRSSKPASEGLIVEEADTNGEEASRRQAELNRRQDLNTAIRALKAELGSREALQSALWKAVSYDQITLEDLQALLDFCHILYEPVEEMKVSLRLPRYWKMQYLGKVSFQASRLSFAH